MATADVTKAGTIDPAAIGQAKRFALEPYDVAIGPVGHLAQERERLARLEWQRFDVKPQSATLGGLIEGVDLTSELDDDTIAEIRRALLEYKVLFFRDQPLTALQHVGFASRFGELEVHPFLPPNSETPKLVRFAKSADIGGYENGWHSDVSWRECPSMGSVLHSLEVPATGGDTLFSDMYAAYDGLDDETKAEAEGLVAVHDYMRAFGHGVPPDEREATRKRFPQVEHPVIRTHPETGRKLMYLNRFFVDHIVGVSEEKSVELVDRLCRQAELPEYQVRFRWEQDSVAFWDNRSVQHYAASDYWPDVRVMERATIIGDRPF